MRIVAVLLFFLLSYFLQGQEHILSNKTHFELLSVKDGLPGNSANAILQSRDGYIWIASFGGLSRYDGYEFKNYQQEAGALVDNYVMELYEDNAGFIWIGTMRKGLQRFDPRTETFITYPTGQSNTIDKYINKITEDAQRNIWVGTMNGLFRLNSPNRTFKLDDIVIDHFSAKAYPDTLLQFLAKAPQTKALLAGVQKVEKKEQRQQAFSIDQKTSIVISSLGEYGGIQKGMVDYGWISNSVGDTIWQMDYTSTYTAKSVFKRGDHPGNRRVIEVLELAAGEYLMHYQSNDKHHYSQWDLTKIPEPFSRKNGVLPAFPELWGIQIYTFEKEQLDWVQQQLHSVNAAQLVSGSSVNDVYVDQQEQLWIATTGGIDRLDTRDTSLTIQHLHATYKNALTFQSDHASSIYEGKNGTLWFCGHQLNQATQKYEFLLETINSAVETPSVSQVLYADQFNHDAKIIEDHTGNIWLSAYFNGLHRLVPSADPLVEYQLEKYPFSTPNARALFVDKFNVLWIGVWKEGIYKLNASAAPFKLVSLPTENKQSYVTSFAESSNGTVYIGTNDQGILKWLPKQTVLTPLSTPQKTHQAIISLLIDDDNQLWAGVNRGGIQVYDLNTDQYIPNFPLKQEALKKNNFKDLKINPTTNNKWISTDGGISHYLADNKQLLFHRTLSDIFWDGASTLLFKEKELIICDNLTGLYVVDLTKELQQLTTKDIQAYYKDITFRSIANDYQTDKVWLGSNDGLHLMDRLTKKLVSFNKQEQFNQIPISNILPDTLGNLWLSMSSGIGKYTIESGAFRLSGANSGIYLNEHNAGPSIMTSWGEILIGGKNGFYHFYPSNPIANPIPADVQLTNFAVTLPPADTSSAPLIIENPTEGITLTYQQNTFEINYVGLHFDKSQDKKYAYRMVGLNDHFIAVNTERKARFTSIPAGTYTFQVRASNGDGIWNEEGANLSIKILPPWWQTYWAYLLYILAFSGIVWAIFSWQIKKIRLHNQLLYEQKEAERLLEIDRLKTNFFSNITHEFRTPLTLIIEPARQLVKKWRGQKDEPTIQLIEKNSQQLLGLVNQLLDLSKLEGGKMTVAWHRGAIFDAIEPIVASFKALAKRKAIEFKVERLEEIPAFYFDKNKIQQILYNLLSNAFKFTEKGIITLSITTKKQPTPHLILKVKDAGIGIASAQLPYIFDRFYQANDTSTNKAGGTGIGLSLTKELIGLMEGTIHVISKVEEGSTFVVTLPALAEVAIAEEITTEVVGLNEGMYAPLPTPIITKAVSKKAVTPEEATEKSLVLLIEDNPELRQFIRQSLEKQYTIIEADNGLVGIHLAKEKIPDIIISDVMMPYKDGFEVCDTLKKEEITAHIPIILLTAKSAIDSKIQGLKTGADAYLTKPFHTEELLVRIEKLIELRQTLQAKYSNVDLTTISKISSLKTDNVTPSTTIEEIKKITKHDQNFLEKVTHLIQEKLSEENLSVEGFAKQLFISRSQLHRKLKALTGSSPNEFIRNYRLDYSLNLLKNKDLKISQVAYEVGFSDEKYFSRRFKERFGFSPSEVV